MELFEQAEALRPPGNDDALLRWNACARMLNRHPEMHVFVRGATGDVGTRVVTSGGARSVNPHDGERKIVTALFADIQGSMDLMAELDPEEAEAVVAPALALMSDAVARYEGHVVQSTGDGIFALFGAPVAYEDHARRALHAALRMQDDIRRYAERLRLEKGTSLAIRVGLNSGEVVVRSTQHGDGTPTSSRSAMRSAWRSAWSASPTPAASSSASGPTRSRPASSTSSRSAPRA